MDYSITYVITTNKNIRCYGCTQNCEKFQKEKYIDLDTFKQHMNVLKKVINISELHFSIGEPLLHKELESICAIAHLFFPQSIICIHTNGVLLNTIKDDQLLKLTKEYNVKFSLYLYPIISYLKTYQKQVERFEKLNVEMYWNHEHIYFNKFSLTKYNLNCIESIKEKKKLFINDGKIYALCPSIQNIQHYLLNNNYIELNNLVNINQIDNLFKSIDCSQCKSNITPLLNLYVNNYEVYEKLIDYVYDLGQYLQIPFFYKNIKDSTSEREFESILNKNLNGILDVFIPFSKNCLQEEEIIELKILLNKQKDIHKINLYFVSIDEDKETQKKWFEIFETTKNFKLNTYFLKGKSLYLGQKKFFDNSRIINQYILDINNLKQLNDPSYLYDTIIKRRTV